MGNSRNLADFATNVGNGGQFSGGGGGSYANSDVDSHLNTNTATTNEVLSYNGSDYEWVENSGGGSGGTVTAYSTIDDLPLTGVSNGAQALVLSTDTLYIWNQGGWYKIALINTNPSLSGANSNYTLAIDGTAIVVTLVASDPEGIPITYSILSDTSGNIATVTQGTGNTANEFTITPTTNTSNGGTFNLTFRASDGVNIASAVSQFSLTFTITNSSKLYLLFATDSNINAGDNTNITDGSASSHTVTAVGNSIQQTFSPYRHGGYSLYFDGTDDYLSVADDASLNFGTGEFTIELWYFWATGGANEGLISKSSSNGNGWTLLVDGNSRLKWIDPTGVQSSPNIQSSSNVNDDEWHHIAITRDSSNNVRMYIDGVEEGTSYNSSSSFDEATALSVGARLSDGNSKIFGYMTDVRVIKGTALYTGTSYTVPTSRLTAVSGTSLLLLNDVDNFIIEDNSTESHTVTVNGAPESKPFSHYDRGPWGADTRGGSFYFDGTGDRVDITHSNDLNFGTGDFTVELWAYMDNALADQDGIISKGNAGTGWQFIFADTNKLKFIRTSGNGSSPQITSATDSVRKNTWTHIALTRSSTTVTLWINGSSAGSYTDSSSWDTSEPLRIGTNRGENNDFHGYISDVRVVKGTAVYTSAFTVPANPLTAITNTTLLLNANNFDIIDKAQNKFIIGGAPETSNTVTKNLDSSIYFDGVDDYIEITDLPSINKQIFTLECWFRIPTGGFPSSGNRVIIGRVDGNGCSFAIDSNNRVRYTSEAGTDIRSSTSSIAADTWYHVAAVREGTGTDQLKLYLDGSEVNSMTDNTDYTNTGFRLGRNSSTGYTQVYISEAKFMVGITKYTAAFTPTTSPLEEG